MNMIEKLKALNVEITPEIEKALSGEWLSELEAQKKTEKATEDAKAWKKRAEAAEETLKGFEGKDYDQLQRELESWKNKAEQAEKDFKAEMEKRDYSDAVKELSKDLKFTSNSARKAFMSELESNPLQMRDGKVLGFEDFVKGYKESDADAFVKEEQETRSKFTSAIKSGGGGDGIDLSAMRSAMGLSNEK